MPGVTPFKFVSIDNEDSNISLVHAATFPVFSLCIVNAARDGNLYDGVHDVPRF